MTPLAWLCIASACAGALPVMLLALVLGFCLANAWAEIEGLKQEAERLQREVDWWQGKALGGVGDDE